MTNCEGQQRENGAAAREWGSSERMGQQRENGAAARAWGSSESTGQQREHGAAARARGSSESTGARARGSTTCEPEPDPQGMVLGDRRTQQ